MYVLVHMYVSMYMYVYINAYVLCFHISSHLYVHPNASAHSVCIPYISSIDQSCALPGKSIDPSLRSPQLPWGSMNHLSRVLASLSLSLTIPTIRTIPTPLSSPLLSPGIIPILFVFKFHSIRLSGCLVACCN